MRFACSSLLVMLLVSGANAQDAKKPAGKANAKQKTNKVLTPAERRKEILAKYDKNKNGKIDPDERKELRADIELQRREALAKRPNPFQQRLLQLFDKNKDGSLDQNETAAARKAIQKNQQDYLRRMQQMMRGGGRGGQRGGRGGRGGQRGGRGGQRGGGNPIQQMQRYFQQIQKQRQQQYQRQLQLQKQQKSK